MTTTTRTRAASSWSQPWQIIGRGFAGWHAQAVNLRSSGGTLEKYISEAAPGCLVYDATDANDEAFTRWTYAGPMRDPAVPAGTVDSYDPARTVATARSLDSINPADWLARLRDEVPGVATGRIVEGRIAWDPPPSHFEPCEDSTR